MLKEALQTMFDTGLPAIVYEELTGDGIDPLMVLGTLNNQFSFYHKFFIKG